MTSLIKNDSILTPETDFLNFDTFDEPLDERNIELNYELYAAAVFLFALGKISTSDIVKSSNIKCIRGNGKKMFAQKIIFLDFFKIDAK
mgnify:CR=1 FL=1